MPNENKTHLSASQETAKNISELSTEMVLDPFVSSYKKLSNAKGPAEPYGSLEYLSFFIHAVLLVVEKWTG